VTVDIADFIIKSPATRNYDFLYATVTVAPTVNTTVRLDYNGANKGTVIIASGATGGTSSMTSFAATEGNPLNMDISVGGGDGQDLLLMVQEA